MPQVEPGWAAELSPSPAATASSVRWRQIAGPATSWGQDIDGECVVSAPLDPDGSTVVMRQEWPWLPLPVPGFETGGSGVSYVHGGTFTLDTNVRDPFGSRTVRVVPSTAWGGATLTTPVTASKTYLFTAQIRGNTPTPGYTLSVSVTWKNSSNGTISSVSGTAVAPPNGSWATITYQGAAPTGATSAEVAVEHSAVSANAYWLGRVDGRDTSLPLQSSDHCVSVGPAAQVRRTVSGDVAVARQRPAMILMDTVRNAELGGPYISGSWWSLHAEGNSPSVQKAWRDVSTNGRFRFLVGAPGTPTGSSQRAELSGQQGPLVRGSTHWWSMAFRFNGRYPTSGWLLFTQVHQDPDASDYDGSPPFGFFVNGAGSLRVARRYDPNAVTTSSSTTTVEAEIAPLLTVGVWHQVVFRLKFDRGGSGGASGSLGVWFNGTQKVNLTNVPFGYNDTLENYPKFGIYRGVGAGFNMVEFANVEIGTTDLSSRITQPLPISF